MSALTMLAIIILAPIPLLSAIDDWLGRIAVIGGLSGATLGLIGFKVGLAQYREAQRWKRAEFVASEVKHFESIPAVQRAMAMLDWTTVEVDFGESGSEYVSDDDLDKALELHDERSGGKFTPLEKSIRDAFDQYLDQIERFQTFIDAGLVSTDDFRPYLEYWIRLMVQPGGRRSPAFRIALSRYLKHYDFDGVQRMVAGLGYRLPDAG